MQLHFRTGLKSPWTAYAVHLPFPIYTPTCVSLRLYKCRLTIVQVKVYTCTSVRRCLYKRKTLNIFVL